eukprot:GFUD01000767.1.p1 GENE.GFUD01000767.1~~GFUD01000767.1.p1  ORF type:complete len:309 (-),score=112.66 GFUD01000767.1:223-1149(-)
MGEIKDENVPFLGIDEFLEEITEVHENILSYNENLEKIDDIQKKLLKGIGWGQEARKNLSNDLDNVIKHNKAIEKTVKSKIKEGYAHSFSSETEERIKQEKLTSLTTLLLESVTKYKNLDIHFKDKSKRKLVNAIKISGVALSEEEIEHKIDNDDLDSFLSASIIQETEEAKLQLGEVKDRHQELKKLEEDIIDLTELYNEMFELVQSQGGTIDIIESKINTTEVNVHEAVGALQVARDLYEKALSKKRILAMIAAALFLILLIIIISATTSGSGPPEPGVTQTLGVVTTTTATPQACDPLEDDDCLG